MYWKWGESRPSRARVPSKSPEELRKGNTVGIKRQLSPYAKLESQCQEIMVKGKVVKKKKKCLKLCTDCFELKKKRQTLIESMTISLLY